MDSSKCRLFVKTDHENAAEAKEAAEAVIKAWNDGKPVVTDRYTRVVIMDEDGMQKLYL